MVWVLSRPFPKNRDVMRRWRSYWAGEMKPTTGEAVLIWLDARGRRPGMDVRTGRAQHRPGPRLVKESTNARNLARFGRNGA
jgi:hypothetical protein